MERNYFTPYELVDNNINESTTKVGLPMLKTFIMAIMAGLFVAIGAQGSGLAVHNIQDYGVAKTIAGLIFPVGLMMIVFIGGQLFTSNCLIGMGVLDQKIRFTQYIKNLLVVFCGNAVGGIFLAVMVFFSGQFDTNHGMLGAYWIKTAIAKANVNPMEALVSGILCNIIVCGCILMAGAAKDVMGKSFVIFMAIWVFVISGFEHCIANLYYLPAGFLAKTNPEYVAVAKEHYGITADQLSSLSVNNAVFNNLLPVTLGNFIGGAVLIGATVYLVFRSKKFNSNH